MTSIGAVFRPQLPPERLRAVVTAAEEAGLEQLWLWEDCFLESGIATAAAALAWSSKLRVGVGLLPVPLRNVALTAMEAATLHRLFPGRVVLGVGHGVLEWMGQVGARVSSPLTLLDEYVTALRALLRGERVTTSGRYVQLSDVALDWPPLTPAPILVGARGPKSVRLSVERADGTILDAIATPEIVRRTREISDKEIIVYAETTSVDLVRELADAGASTVVLQQSADATDAEEFMRFVASVTLS
ncbi:oxidoreductase [Lentzea sp. NBRC 105346]|uniref:LLM class flavin-dependent oxidoreductase n=1 Tax=Lentzea sp. NBRC 105346 TaxID=3032205 RepID=UPI0024A3B8DE|nr:LLM class flavin-dependent oxidoreductase [Lentzea sp. NBRC 105346]GLZ33335.1 oxidoreductase [Lentzea sp. NBRC 105346]